MADTPDIKESGSRKTENEQMSTTEIGCGGIVLFMVEKLGPHRKRRKNAIKENKLPQKRDRRLLIGRPRQKRRQRLAYEPMKIVGREKQRGNLGETPTECQK